MAQTDVIISNATPAAVRSDLNDHLEALVTVMSGPTSPPINYPNMIRFDTTPGILIYRNPDNDAWINCWRNDQAETCWVAGGTADNLLVSNLVLAEPSESDNQWTKRQVYSSTDVWIDGGAIPADQVAGMLITYSASGIDYLDSIASVGAGTVIRVRGTSQPFTIRHNPDKIFVPGRQDVAGASGDIFTLIEQPDGTWRVINMEFSTAGSIQDPSVELLQDVTSDGLQPVVLDLNSGAFSVGDFRSWKVVVQNLSGSLACGFAESASGGFINHGYSYLITGGDDTLSDTNHSTGLIVDTPAGLSSQKSAGTISLTGFQEVDQAPMVRAQLTAQRTFGAETKMQNINTVVTSNSANVLTGGQYVQQIAFYNENGISNYIPSGATFQLYGIRGQ